MGVRARPEAEAEAEAEARSTRLRPEAGAVPRCLRPICFRGNLLWPGVFLYWKMKRFEAGVGAPQRGLGPAGCRARKLRVPKSMKACS